MCLVKWTKTHKEFIALQGMSNSGSWSNWAEHRKDMADMCRKNRATSDKSVLKIAVERREY
jgi:hypothetical protein